MSSAHVCIVLATYNGARYLPEQLRSLSAQSRPPNRLVLRDDGSSDDSVGLVRQWATASGVTLAVETGPRLGPAQSFLTALRAAGDADLYLFCDQDDVWLPHRIERALGFVPRGQGAVPTLYASTAVIVDEALRNLGTTAKPARLSFASAACESLLTGCTMAFNASLRDRLVVELPRYTPMHDWWVYLVASAYGTLLFDETPGLLYRQHRANVLGAGPSGLAELGARFRRALSSESAMRSRQLEELERIHGPDLPPAALELTRMLLAAKRRLGDRLRAGLFAPVQRQGRMRRLSTRLAILSNRF